MSCHPRVTAWPLVIQTHLPHLRKSQATVFALWSLGMVLARAWALTALSAFLATWLGRQEPAVRQQLRAFGSEATAKRGATRCALAVEPCVVPLLAWVVGQWEGTPWALALEATTLGTRLTVLAIRVVYRGCAIPVAWTVLSATATHAWRRAWVRMLRQVRRAVPRSWTVIVLDEGDMEIELPVAPWEAALGAKVRVSTLEGAVDMTVPAGAQGGQRLRLRGQGMQRSGSGRGDQYVRLTLVNPPTLTDSERALFEQLAAASHFNPRELTKG